MSTGDESRERSLDAVRQQRRGVRAALGDVERALASPSRSAAWAGDLERQLRALGDAFDHHVRETERPDGLFAEVVQQAPRLNHRVDQLRDDHRAIQSSIDATLTEFPADGPPDDERVAKLRDGVISVLTALVRHRHLGADLVYEAYSVDIEAAD